MKPWRSICQHDSRVGYSHDYYVTSQRGVYTSSRVNTDTDTETFQFFKVFLHPTGDLSRCSTAHHSSRNLLPPVRAEMSTKKNYNIEKFKTYLFFSPSGISSNSRSNRCCSETDQDCLYVSDFGFPASLDRFPRVFPFVPSEVTVIGAAFLRPVGKVSRARILLDGRRVRTGVIVVDRAGEWRALCVSSMPSGAEFPGSHSEPPPSNEISTSPLSSSKSRRIKTPSNALDPEEMVNPQVILRLLSPRIFARSRSLLVSSESISSSSSECKDREESRANWARTGSTIVRLASLTSFCKSERSERCVVCGTFRSE